MGVFKRCSCGREHTADGWLLLEFVGTIHNEADEYGPAETVEMRNCPACGSTMAILLTPAATASTLPAPACGAP